MKFSAYLRLSRPVNILIASLSVLLMASLMDRFPPLSAILSAMAVVAMLNAAANAVNDISDIEVDRINRPRRPLPAAELSIAQARRFALIMFIAGNALSLTLGLLPAMISALIATPLMIWYSSTLKVTPFWGNLVIACILGMALIFAASAYGDWRAGLIPAALAFGINLIREIVKDLQDMEGDARREARTLPFVLGERGTRKLAGLLSLLMLAALPLPWLQGAYSLYYLIPVLLTVGLPLAWMSFLFFTQKPLNYGKFSTMLKVTMLFGLVSIYAGRLNA